MEDSTTTWENDLDKLEASIGSLLDALDEVRKENQILHKENSVLRAESKHIRTRSETVRSRVESMITRLKVMEQSV